MDDKGKVKYITAEGKTIVEETRLRTELQEAKESLETRVKERTSELIEAIEKLKNEIAERKRAEETLRKSEIRLAEAQKIAHLGNWDWNILTNELYWSDEIYRIFGLQPQEFGATYDAFLDMIHPEDRELVERSVNEALNKNKPYSIDHRIVLPSGEVRVVHEQAEVTFDKSGKPIRMVGTVQDITARKQMEKNLKKKLMKK
ncbi:MAG: PAS domain S-box protein [Thermoplasmata archaeon]|nr:MAG: PAS domain S-box protein [Thermoplasmata archaeon]